MNEQPILQINSLILEAQKKVWDQLVRIQNKLPQSLLMLGPEGSGKHVLLKQFYKLLHCQSQNAPCDLCASCSKIEKDLHADFLVISPKKEQLHIDDFRELKKILYFAPFEGKYRFILIESAHKLNTSSANSILKILEEPPAHTRFFLLTHERALLLPTIISRSQYLYFSPLSRNAIERALELHNVILPENIKDFCFHYLNGGIQRIATFTDEKVLSFIQLCFELIRKKDYLLITDSLGPEDWKTELFLEALTYDRYSKAKQAASDFDSIEAFHFANTALEAVFLSHRLSRHANRKLIGLASSLLATQNSLRSTM